jgi:hypothetical protein
MGGILSYIWPTGGLFWLFCGASGFIALVCLAVSISSALYLIAEMAEVCAQIVFCFCPLLSLWQY